MRESAEAQRKLRGASGSQEEFQEDGSATCEVNEHQNPLDALRRPEVMKELHVGVSHRNCSAVLSETTSPY